MAIMNDTGKLPCELEGEADDQGPLRQQTSSTKTSDWPDEWEGQGVQETCQLDRRDGQGCQVSWTDP